MSRISLLVCTPDSSTPRFQKCYKSILATTRGYSYDLRIVDNRRSADFSQQREINKALSITDGPVVNLDDDTEMMDGWLECLLDHCTGDTGLLCCNAVDRPSLDKALFVPSTGLCCALLNPDFAKCGLGVDENYKKYFFDPDLCLSLWEAGFTCSVVPAQIIHNSGGGVREMGLDRMALYNADKQRFRDKWITTGRYAVLQAQHGHLWDAPLRKAMYA